MLNVKQIIKIAVTVSADFFQTTSKRIVSLSISLSSVKYFAVGVV